MYIIFWEADTFFGVPASFFYPLFVADSSRICGNLCGFIGNFLGFHLDESGEFIKMNGKGRLDGQSSFILMKEKRFLDKKLVR